MAKITPHLFHGIYSNSGYGPLIDKGKWSPDTLYNDYPIHINRAFYAKTGEGLVQPKEFESENDAFKWYKQVWLKSSDAWAQTPKEERPSEDDLVKNYIKIPETDFYKYRHLFNGMTKSISLNIDIEADLKTSLTPVGREGCCDQEPSSSEPPEPSDPWVSGGGSQAIFNILDLLDDLEIINDEILLDNDTQEQINYEDINQKEKIKILEEPDCPCCPPEDADLSTQRSSITVKTTYQVNTDQVFTLKDLEKRVPASFLLERSYYQAGNGDVYNQLSSRGWSLYKDDWVFDKENLSLYFGANPADRDVFPNDTTYINDPVLLINNRWDFYGIDKFLPGFAFGFNYEYPGTNDNQWINANKKPVKIDNFGVFTINVSNVKEQLVRRVLLNCYVQITFIAYSKKDKCFLVFIETELQNTVNRRRGDLFQESFALITTKDVQVKRKVTWFGQIFPADESQFACPYDPTPNDPDRYGFKMIKSRLEINIGSLKSSIEVYKPSTTLYSTKTSKTSIKITSPPNKCDFSEAPPPCANGESNAKFDVKKFEITFNPWEDTDFDSKNTFPKKFS